MSRVTAPVITAVHAEAWFAQNVPPPATSATGFPYTYDQVVEAIASTRGDGTQFVLTRYLHLHRDDVGRERIRRLLETAKLRTQDEMAIRLRLAGIDPTYVVELPALLRSARSIEAQQALLAGLPDVVPRERQSAVADELEAWLRRRVTRASYLENGASWEIPSVLLAVLYSADASRARTLLMELDPHLDDRERPLARAAHASSDKDFEAILRKWHGLDSSHRELSPGEIAASDAETEAEAARYMRRLGFPPTA